MRLLFMKPIFHYLRQTCKPTFQLWAKKFLLPTTRGEALCWAENSHCFDDVSDPMFFCEKKETFWIQWPFMYFCAYCCGKIITKKQQMLWESKGGSEISTSPGGNTVMKKIDIIFSGSKPDVESNEDKNWCFWLRLIAYPTWNVI